MKQHPTDDLVSQLKTRKLISKEQVLRESKIPSYSLGSDYANFDPQCEIAQMTRTLSRHQVSCHLNALYLPSASKYPAAPLFAHTTNALMRLHSLNCRNKHQLGPALCVLNRLALSLCKLTSKCTTPPLTYLFLSLTSRIDTLMTSFSQRHQIPTKSLLNPTVYGQAPLIPTRQNWEG